MRERLATSAKVLQEMLHRYVAIDRRDAIYATRDAVPGVADVFPVERADLEHAQRVLALSP